MPAHVHKRGIHPLVVMALRWKQPNFLLNTDIDKLWFIDYLLAVRNYIAMCYIVNESYNVDWKMPNTKEQRMILYIYEIEH